MPSCIRYGAFIHRACFCVPRRLFIARVFPLFYCTFRILEHFKVFITFTQNFFKCSNVSVQFWNVLQTYMKCFETIWNIIQTNLKYFLIIQNIMKCLTLFIGNFSCSQTNQHVLEHSEMFQKKVLNVSELFPNILMFQYNSEMFLQTYLQYFTTIFEIFWNNLKYF